jgi:hypothetical protein
MNQKKDFFFNFFTKERNEMSCEVLLVYLYPESGGSTVHQKENSA